MAELNHYLQLAIVWHWPSWCDWVDPNEAMMWLDSSHFKTWRYYSQENLSWVLRVLKF